MNPGSCLRLCPRLPARLHRLVTAPRCSLPSVPGVWKQQRKMATVKDSVPHTVRTADDRRQSGLYAAVLSRIEIVNQNIRLLRLDLPDGPVRHLPGQYVDLHIPGVDVVGGFTITSPPLTALSPPPAASSTVTSLPYVELAIQRSPRNPPAAYLYRDPAEIINDPVSIGIGGNFTYPPFTLSRDEFLRINRVVFIAGGVGINPIMSMITAMSMANPNSPGGMKPSVHVLYSSKREQTTDESQESSPPKILFEDRLAYLAKRIDQKFDFKYTLFETSGNRSSSIEEPSSGNRQYLYRRLTKDDLLGAIGPEGDRKNTLVYVCGLPTMTDEFVEFLRSTPGLDEKRVLCEKWW